MYSYILYFFIYGFLGWCTEVAFAAFKERRFVNRGFLYGPICPVYGIGVSLVILLLRPFASSLPLLYLTSTIVVTALEWLTGFLLEKLFHSRWWDYSDMPLNLNGYVCLLFSLIWGAACVFIVKIFHPAVSTLTGLLPIPVGIILIILLSIILFSDLYTTASGILKLNRRLEKMEQIARELHEISDDIGENIYKNVIETMEFGEEQKQNFQNKKDAVSEDMKKHILELKAHYCELTEQAERMHHRLLNAFPHLNSPDYHTALKDIREHLKNLKK